MRPLKRIEFCGDSLEVLRHFPEAVRRRGLQLERVQLGLEPRDWKPMPAIGAGVREIRIRVEVGAFRVIYVTTFGDKLYCIVFKKKSQKTSSSGLATAVRRYKELEREQSP